MTTLYTVLSMEEVFAGTIQVQSTTMEVSYGGMLLQVEPIGGGEARIVRLLDCPLAAYLDPAYAPGAVIRLA